MTNFVLLNRIFRKSASEPRLLSLESPDAEEYDMTFEAALLDVRLSHSLHADYDGVQPPPDAYCKLLAVIESGEKKQAGAPKVGSGRALSFGDRFSQAIRYLVPKPTRARLVSGALTLVMMAAVIGPYLSTMVDHSSNGLPSNNRDSYDYQALRESDPPEMWAPHPQTKIYFSIREPDPNRGEMHKE